MPGKPGRSTDLAAEFPALIRQYVVEAKAVNAVPILVTPLVRRSFKDGKIKNDLLPWAESIRQVARDEQVALLDLNALSAAAIEQLGAVEALNLAQSAPSSELIAAAATGTTIDAPRPVPRVTNCDTAPSTQNCIAPVSDGLPRGSYNANFDYTHLGETGAKMISAIVAKELARVMPELSNSIIP
jgi:lysophospholipase L1-like esterase